MISSGSSWGSHTISYTRYLKYFSLRKFWKMVQCKVMLLKLQIKPSYIFVKLLNGCDKTQLYSRWYLTLRFMFFYYYSSETLLCCFSSCSVSNFHIRFLSRKMFYIWIQLPNLRHCIIFHNIAIYCSLDNFSN